MFEFKVIFFYLLGFKKKMKKRKGNVKKVEQIFVDKKITAFFRLTASQKVLKLSKMSRLPLKNSILVAWMESRKSPAENNL